MSGFARVVLVGAGLIGGSVARRLQARGALGAPEVSVTVVDPAPDTRAAAEAVGLRVADVIPGDADLVVLAVPLDRLPGAFAEAARAAPDAVVVDVGSVKQTPADAAAVAGLGERYVGCHPMAGTEHSGFAHSSAELLVAATWAVTHSGGLAQTVRVVAWVTEVFDATAVVLDAAAHDRAVALVSHAPHAVAHSLLAVVEESADPGLAGLLAAGSFRDGTRVAGRNAARTLNMLTENASALRPVLDALMAELGALRDELDDPGALHARLTRAVAHQASVRHAEPAFEPCPALDEAIARSRASGDPLVVRRGAGGLETSVTSVTSVASEESGASGA